MPLTVLRKPLNGGDKIYHGRRSSELIHGTKCFYPLFPDARVSHRSRARSFSFPHSTVTGEFQLLSDDAVPPSY